VNLACMMMYVRGLSLRGLPRYGPSVLAIGRVEGSGCSVAAEFSLRNACCSWRLAKAVNLVARGSWMKGEGWMIAQDGQSVLSRISFFSLSPS